VLVMVVVVVVVVEEACDSGKLSIEKIAIFFQNLLAWLVSQAALFGLTAAENVSEQALATPELLL